MAISFSYTESTNIVVQLEGTEGTPATFADFVHFDRTLATSACTIASGAELKAATTIGASTDLTLTYPVRPVENKALLLAITTAQGDTAVSGDETVDIYGTTCIWHKMTGASASGQKVVPIADMTHNYQVGDTVILIDISAPSTYETDTIASIAEGVSITMTNNNTNSYATGDIVGIYQTEQIDTSAAHGTYWSTVSYGQIAKLTFTGYAGTNTGKIDQPIWGVIWDLEDKRYRLDCFFNVGDADTSTYFKSFQEQIVFSLYGGVAHYVIATANATLQSGDKVGTDKGKRGSTWLFDQVQTGAGSTTIDYGNYHGLEGDGKILFYASRLCSYFHPLDENYIYKNPCLLVENDDSEFIGVDIHNFDFIRLFSDCVFKRINIWGTNVFQVVRGPTIDKVINLDSRAIGIYIVETSDNDGEYIFRNVESDNDFRIGWNRSDIWMIDSSYVGFVLNWTESWATGNVYESYSCNIHVADKDGTNLSGVTVDCEDTNGDAVWAAGSITTDANGDITEQTINYKHWYQPNQEDALTPHKFTISYAGLETLVMESITVDAKIVWHLELQPMRARNYARSRVQGVNFQ